MSNQAGTIDNTNYYLVIVTTILAAITEFYAFQTKKTVDALKDSTKSQFRPFLKASIFSIGPTALALEITNVGKGPAREVSAEFKVKEFDETDRTWNQTLLMPNDFQRFFIPKDKKETVYDLKFFQDDDVTLELAYKFKDIFWEQYSYSETIDVSKYARQFDDDVSLYLEKPIDKIAGGIEDIASKLSRIEKGLEGMLKTIKNLSQQPERGRTKWIVSGHLYTSFAVQLGLTGQILLPSWND
jgi:hypothetical protein